jgi:recombination protein RecR
MQFSSHLLEAAVNEFSKLPGIGKKTALRLVLHLLKQPTADSTNFSNVITQMRNQIKFCTRCNNISDTELCSICNNTMRKKELLCVVENIRDVIAIESTQQFNGVYHVLGGIISPLDGIGPEQLTIDSLVQRIPTEQITEIIFALNPNIQGDTTVYYIAKKLKNISVKITTIARGIAFGGELEYADEMTLAKSISNRIPVEQYIQN